MLDSLVFLSSFTKEIHHGSAPRSDGTGPQTPRPQSRHHPQLPAESKEVLDILNLHSTLKRCYGALADKSGIDEDRLTFSGFDGNNEGKQMAYARYYCNLDGGRFDDLYVVDLNSHFPTMQRYRPMVAEWKESDNKYELTKEDIVRITTVKPNEVSY
jgi:uncharacterized protein YfbU (UPF0304 family)